MTIASPKKQHKQTSVWERTYINADLTAPSKRLYMFCLETGGDPDKQTPYHFHAAIVPQLSSVCKRFQYFFEDDGESKLIFFVDKKYLSNGFSKYILKKPGVLGKNVYPEE